MDSNDPAPGALLGGKYRVIATLGAGAMGRVFQARNELTDKAVALKWMRPEVAAMPNAAERLLREARAASKLKHPNVVEVYDIAHDGSTLFLVMELLEGETLSTYLRRNRQPLLSEFIALLLQALEGVAAAHEKGVVHRDLKPDNIFLVREEGSEKVTVKVVDFGVAKLTGPTTTTITATGSAVGSPFYMSLEQLRGDRDIDGRSDLYAFGVMLFEAITGAMPYSASSLPELAIKVATSDPVSVQELRPDVPQSLARIVDRACARNREQRFPSARALIAELEGIAGEQGFRLAMTTSPSPLPLVAASERALPPGVVTLPDNYVPTVPGQLPTSSGSTLYARETAAREQPLRRFGTSWRIAAAIALSLALVAAAVKLSQRAQPGEAPSALAPAALESTAVSSAEPASPVTKNVVVGPDSTSTPDPTEFPSSSPAERPAKAETGNGRDPATPKRRDAAAVDKPPSAAASRAHLRRDPLKELGF